MQGRCAGEGRCSLNSKLIGSLHHIGVCLEESVFFAKYNVEKTQWDAVQGVHTYWELLGIENIYVEYFTRTGRAKNYPIGFNHVCFNMPSKTSVMDFSENLKRCRLGIELTSPEKSGSIQCGDVAFVYLRGLGIIELNSDG